MMEARHLEDLAKQIIATPRKGRRLIVAVAGAPASGKSTLAEDLCDHLVSRGRKAQVVPMDGFHLENDVLDARGLLARKGAPETFDLAGFTELLLQIAQDRATTYPVFDRQRDTAIRDGGTLADDTEIVIVEGNYLLLDEAGWRELQAFWDVSLALVTPLDVLRERLIARWVHHGLERDSAVKRAESNDIPNAERVVRGSAEADIVVLSDKDGTRFEKREDAT